MMIPDLQALARKVLDFGIEYIRNTKGELLMQFHLVAQDNRQEVYLIADHDLYSKAGKDAIAAKIRERVAKGDIEAVILLGDTYWCDDMTPENDRLRQALGMELDEAAKAGLCTIKEGVFVSLESPIYTESLRQEYRRLVDGGGIELVGEPSIDKVAPDRSRMTGWFASGGCGVQ